MPKREAWSAVVTHSSTRHLRKEYLASDPMTQHLTGCLQQSLLGSMLSAGKGREQVRGCHICAAAPPLSTPQSISKTEDIREAAQRRGAFLRAQAYDAQSRLQLNPSNRALQVCNLQVSHCGKLLSAHERRRQLKKKMSVRCLAAIVASQIEIACMCSATDKGPPF